MYWVVIAVGILAVWLSGSASAWAQDCEPLRPSQTIDTEVRNVTEANANILLGSLSQGNIRNDYQRIEQRQKFSNPDDVNRWSSFIYMLCTLLQRSSLSDNDKLAQYFKLVELSQQSPPTEPAPPPPPPREQDGVLYETGVGNDGFEGWSLTPDWKRLSNGMLVNNGTGPYSRFVPVFAPYQPESADYVVEAEVQVVQGPASSFGVVVRANVGQQNGREGYAAGVGGGWDRTTNICYLNGWWGTNDMSDCKAKGEEFDPGQEWHTYRVEANVNNIKLFIDGAPMTEVTDNMFLLSSRVGLWSNGYQLQVRKFRVLKLQPR